MSITLTPDELLDLTHYKRAADQIAALNQMGIDHYVRPDGTPAVLRVTLEGGTAQVDMADYGDTRPWIDEGLSPEDWLKRESGCLLFTDDQIVSGSEPYSPGSGPVDSGVYFIVSDHTITYVGISNNVAIRLKSHHDDGRFHIERFFVIQVPTLLCLNVESYYINRIRPLWNVAIPPLYFDLEKHAGPC